MSIPRITAIALGLLAAGYFGWALKGYFRPSESSTFEKKLLSPSIIICTVVQIAMLLLAEPPSPWFWWGASLAYAASIGLFTWTARSHGNERPELAFGKNAPSTFHARGPYRFVRHPFYLAYSIGWLPGPIVTLNPWLLLTNLWMGFLYYRAASMEEHSFLEGPNAEQYRQYQSRTGMFLPKPFFDTKVSE